MASVERLIYEKLVPLYGDVSLTMLLARWKANDPTASTSVTFKRAYWENFEGSMPSHDADPALASFQVHVDRIDGVVQLAENAVMSVVTRRLDAVRAGRMVGTFDGERVVSFTESPTNQWAAQLIDLPPAGTAGVFVVEWSTSAGVVRSESFRAVTS